MFNIDFQLLAQRLLTVFDSFFPIVSGWVKVMVWPLKYINDEFQAFIISITRQLSYTSQVILMEAALNDTFPGAVPPIYISDADSAYQTGYDFLVTDGQPDPGGYDYLATDGVLQSGYDYLAEDYSNRINFIVNVPSSLSYSTDEMTALIQKYTPVDKNFIIHNF